MKRFTYWLLLLTAMALLLPSCIGITPSKYRPRDDAPKEEMPLSRADPAFVQYLERQSMLAKSSEMAKVVSGSELAWRSSASSGEPGAMMNYADTWVLIHPLTLLTTSRSSAFALLDDASSWPVFREAGARGLYVAPIQGGGAIWRKPGSGLDSGEDVVQYDFSRTAGTDKEYGRLMGKSIDNGAIIGSDLIPAATGLGPDFFLATRNVREYPGVYCMVEVPEQHWGLLPALGENDESAALSASEVAALSKLGLLPKAMRDAASSMGQIGGWATSAPVRAVDGNKYRWVYRYHGSPKYAVLNWEDPSQTAHRILSGSAVRQVGLQGQALIGLRFEAFQGLEAAQEGAAASSFSIEPALTAAQSMSREIRKYGGWSWLRDDDLPLKSVQRFLSGGTDFIYDSVFSPAAEHALLTGDASLAKFMADEALRLKIDARKLVHVMPGQDGINYSLPHIRQLAEGAGGKKAADFVTAVRNTMRNIASRATPSPASGNYLYVTAPGLAALALGAGTEEAAHKQLASIRKGHSLLTFFKAMQPGVMMLAGQDLCGALPLQWGGHTGNSKNFSAADSSRGAYGLTSSTARLSVSAHGVPRAPTLYPAPDMQVH